MNYNITQVIEAHRAGLLTKEEAIQAVKELIAWRHEA